jgi:hypothetical protein
LGGVSVPKSIYIVIITRQNERCHRCVEFVITDSEMTKFETVSRVPCSGWNYRMG